MARVLVRETGAILRTFGGTTHMNLPTRAAPLQLFNSTAATLASSIGLERSDDAIVTGRCARQLVDDILTAELDIRQPELLSQCE